MTKPAKSQWDFGELFPEEPQRQVLSVSEVTTRVRRALEQQVGQVWVLGEITNFRAQGSSGHIYFTLKDSAAQLSCVLFRGEALAARAYLADGQKVVLQGAITVYEVRGQYQMRVTAVELQGTGALQIAFEKLKSKLAAEGLFSADRKRPLPRYAQRLGLVTSPDGAALRDVLHVIERRNPGLEIFLAPCCVQGQGAGTEIAAAIRLLNEWSRRQQAGCGLDLLLITRGGGSLEDLWAFNEEAVARAIFDSELPVVSAVGHEIDFTISDFVADLRAATPSAAAELITEGVVASCRFLSQAGGRLKQLAFSRLNQEKRAWLAAVQRLDRLSPRRRLEERSQLLDELQQRLRRGARQILRHEKSRAVALTERLRLFRPRQLLESQRQHLNTSRRQLREQAKRLFLLRTQSFQLLQQRLRLLSPLQVLARGYSITVDASTGKVLRRSSEAIAGQVISTRLAHGDIKSRVTE